MLITLKYSQVYIFGILPGKAQKFFFPPIIYQLYGKLCLFYTQAYT